MHDFKKIDVSIAEDLHIVGFLDVLDIASPPVLSRHLILPTIDNKDGETLGDMF